MRDIQALHPDYRALLCHYCDGRGFTLVPQPDIHNPDKETCTNVVVECKFCGGQGLTEPGR